MTDHTDTHTATTADPDVVYHGRQTERGGVVHLETPDGRVLGRLRHVVWHSPAGMNWGYGGSGPADCARSILIHALGPDVVCRTCAGTTAVVYHPATDQYRPADPRRATGHDPELVSLCWDCTDGYRPLPYQRFKFDVVARFGPEWRMRRAEVLTWFQRTQTAAPTARIS
jgi:hypothetical protein